MTEYNNMNEKEIRGFSIFEDEITIEFDENREYRFFVLTEKIIGGQAFRTICHAARAGNGLLEQFGLYENQVTDKW